MAYQILVTIHVLAAATWFGGIMMMAAVIVPVARRFEPTQRRSLIDKVGRSFRIVGWLAIVTLIVTGTWMVVSWGVTWDEIFSGEFLENPRYRVLSEKIAMVAVMTVVSFFHDWVLGPRSLELPVGGSEEKRAKIQARVLAMITTILTVLIIIWAVRVARPWFIAVAAS